MSADAKIPNRFKKCKKSKTPIKIVLMLKALSMIGVYASFNNGNVLHSLTAATCAISWFFVKFNSISKAHGNIFEAIEIEVLGLILILIPLAFALHSNWEGNWKYTILSDGVNYLVVDALITLVISRLIWRMSKS